MSTTQPDIYSYPEGASPLDLARYQVAVMEAAERGLPVETQNMDSTDGWWWPLFDPKFDSWEKTRYRIEKPRPPKLAEGHNPDGLTEEQVGVSKGYRLLTRDEVDPEGCRDYDKRIERWGADANAWDDSGWCGGMLKRTYRTKQPVGFYLPKPPVPPAPAALVPWTIETAPKGVVLVKRKNQFGSPVILLLVGWDEDGVCSSQSGSDSYRTLLEKYEHSLDGGKTWLSCGSQA